MQPAMQPLRHPPNKCLNRWKSLGQLLIRLQTLLNARTWPCSWVKPAKVPPRSLQLSISEDLNKSHFWIKPLSLSAQKPSRCQFLKGTALLDKDSTSFKT